MYANNGTLITMSNMSAANTSWQLAFNIPSADRTSTQNVTFKCGNTTALKEWYNTTNGFLFFTPKNAKYTILDRVIINNSILKTKSALNITIVSDNATNCTFNYNNAGEQAALMTQSNRGFWTNASTIVAWSETAFGTWSNITYNCTDSAGNYSGSGMYFFKLDTAAPTFPATPVFSSIGNKTTGGNYITLTINSTDANPSYCGASLYWSDGTRTNVSTEVSFNLSTTNANCSLNVTPSDITNDGYVEVVPFMKDNAGNENTSTTNQSYIFYRLKTGWNVITGYENKTLTQIAGEFTNVTYVSVWDNLNKVFVTFTVGGATNSGIGSNITSNYSAGAAYIYVNANVNVMRRYYAPPAAWLNISLFSNNTTNTPWNLVGITKQLTDLNATLMGNVCTNLTGTIVGANCANLTWFSYYSVQEGKFCSFYRNRLATSCARLTNETNLTRGDALWIAVQSGANVTLIRGSWS
jgi:hypothetical protein